MGRLIAKRRDGFSMVELLVTIGIIALLIAILLPVVSHVRMAARGTACLSNLRQWAQSFELYLNNNHGQPAIGLEIHQRRPWWELLSPYNSNVKATLLCPEAIEKSMPSARDPSLSYGAAHKAWWIARNDSAGSYGWNYWIKGWSEGNTHSNLKGWVRFPARKSEQVPLIADCCWPWASPDSGAVVPRNLQYPEDGIDISLGVYCIDRHQMGVNVVFVDGHAERVELSQLWKLRWSEDFVPRDVAVPRP
jgi:prepilin-type N-terminal cleavage/methylation domain-containing protein/prepilin-type processing-associated H-X9-DG protein